MTPTSRKRCSGKARLPDRSRGPRHYRPWFETLETRCLMSVSWISTQSGFWDVGGNWSGGQVPGSGDDVTIAQPGVTVTVRDAEAAHTLAGGDALVLAAGATPGALTVGAASTFDGAVTLNAGTTLTLSAATTLGGTVSLNGGSLVTNDALTLSGAATWSSGTIGGSGSVTVGSTGALNAAGSGTLALGLPLNNTGTVDVQSGTLKVTGTVSQVSGTTLTGGTWDVANNATLNLSSAPNLTASQAAVALGGPSAVFTQFATVTSLGGSLTLTGGAGFSAGGALTVGGSVSLDTGTLQLNNHALTIGSGGSLTLGSTSGLSGETQVTNSGTFAYGGSGTMTLAAPFNNTGGTIDVQGGTLAFGRTGTSSGGTFNASQGATLLLNGLGTVTGTYQGSGQGTIALNGGGLTIGAGGATFDFAAGLFTWSAGFLSANQGGALTNAGFLAIDPTAGPFLSSGSTVLNTGTLAFQGTGSFNPNTLTNQAGGTVDFTSSAGLSGGSLTNLGTVLDTAPSGTTTTINAAFNNQGGTIDVQSGTLQFGLGGTSTGAAIEVSQGATLLLNGIGTLTGTYTGSGQGKVGLTGSGLTIGAGGATFDFAAGLFTWSAGFLSANQGGALTNAGFLAIDPTAGPFLSSGSTVLNTGTLAFQGTGSFNPNTLTNQAGGTVDFTSSAGLSGGSLTNLGTVLDTAPSGTTTTINAAFNNQNAPIDVQGGTLKFTGGGTSTGATFTLSQGGAAVLDGFGTLTGTYTGSGQGTVGLDGGGLTIGNAGATFNFPAGLFQWTGGQIAGQTTQAVLANPAALTLAGSGQKTLNGVVLNNTGTITQQDTGLLSITLALNNQAGAMYDIQSDGSFVGPDGRRGHPVDNAFNNLGTLKKSGGTGLSQILGAFNNRGGTIDVETGILQDEGSGQQIAGIAPVSSFNTGGFFHVAPGATLDLTGTNADDERHFVGTYTGDGGGTVTLGAGLFGIDPGGATFNFPAGMLVFTNAKMVNGGTFTNAGFLTIDPTAQENPAIQPDNTLVNTGTILVNGDPNASFSGGAITNEAGGLINWQTDMSFSGVPGIVNAGTIRKSGGTGVTEFSTASFDNTGTVEADSGTLLITSVKQMHDIGFGSILTGGTWVARDGATLDLRTGSPAFANAPPVQNDLISSNEGTLIIDGAGSSIPEIDIPAVLTQEFLLTSFLASNSGTLSLLDGHSLHILLPPSGRIVPSGNLSNSGTITLGPGSTLQVDGTYTQTGTGTLSVQIGDHPASGQFGQLKVGGKATLAGALDVTLAQGFAPSTGDAYTTLTCAQRTGDFATTNGVAPEFAESASDTSVVLTGNAAPPDLEAQSVTAPATGTAGQMVTIPFSVQNVGGPLAPGDWTDSFYLSAGTELNSDAILIGRKPHHQATLLSTNAGYSDTFMGTLPGVLPGTYHVILAADSQGQVPDPGRANNRTASTTTIQTDVTPLTLGTPVTGTITAGQDAYFQIATPAGQDLQLSATFTAAQEAGLYVGLDTIPSQAVFDQTAPDVSALATLINIAPGPVGIYIVLLHGLAGAAGGQSFTLQAAAVPFALQSLGVTQGGNAGQVTVPLLGTGLQANLQANLNGPDGKAHPARAVVVSSGTRADATFDLTGLAPGNYQVQAVQGNATQTAAQAFQIVAGDPGHFQVQVVVPAVGRPGVEYEAYLEYSNTGGTDLTAPLVLLDSPTNNQMRLSQTDSEQSFLQVQAIAPDGPPGVLHPGQSGTIPFFIMAHNDNNDIAASVGTTDDTEPMDYATLQKTLEPNPADPQFDPTLTQLATQAGPTVGDYARLLGQAANLQYQRAGVRSPDANSNLDFLITDAEESANATLSGRLFLGDTQHPLANVSVEAFNVDTGAVAGNGQSALDGTLRFAALPPGSYQLSFLGYLPFRTGPVVIPASGTLVDQTFVVQPGGTIIGSISAPVGTDFTTDTAPTVTADNGVGDQLTANVAANGQYTITGLPAGTYTIHFSGGNLFAPDVTSVAVQDRQTTIAPAIVAQTGGSIQGVVRDQGTGLPLAGAAVNLQDASNPVVAVTDANGAYTLTGVAPGPQQIVANLTGYLPSAAQNVQVSAGQTTQAADIALSPAAGLQGTVTFQGNPVSGARVALWPTDTASDQVLTDAQGHYQFTTLLAGTYALTVDGPFQAVLNDSVTLTAGQTLTQDEVLTSAAFVQGVIQVQGTNAPLPGNGITLLQPDGTVINSSADVNGAYSFTRLAPGHYTLMLPEGSHRQSFDIVDATTQVTINFTLAVGSAQGNIFLPDGVTPDAGAQATLLENGQSLLTVPVDPNTGNYLFSTINPGTYDIAFADGTNSFPLQTGVVVTSGTTTSVPDVVPGTASVQLSFVDSSNQPITGEGTLLLTQRALPADLGTPQVIDIPATGGVLVSGLQPGDYLAHVNLPGKAPVQLLLTIPAGASSQTITVPDIVAVSGQVTSDGATPVDQIDILAYDPAQPALVYRAKTDSQGNYLLNLPAGTYTIVAADNRAGFSGPRFALTTVSGVAAPAGGSVTQNFVLSAATISVAGQVHDTVGDLPASGTLTATNADGVPVLTASLDTSGNYALPTLAPGSYTLRVVASGYTVVPQALTVVAGQAVTGLDLSATWLIDAAPSPSQLDKLQTGIESLPDKFRQLVNTIVAGMRSQLGEPQELKDFTRNDLILPDRLFDCPDALAWFRAMLVYQAEAHALFSNYHQKWQAQLDINLANLGRFGADLGIACASVYTGRGTGVGSGEITAMEKGLNKLDVALEKDASLTAQEYKAAYQQLQDAKGLANRLFYGGAAADVVGSVLIPAAFQVDEDTGKINSVKGLKGAFVPDLDQLSKDFSNATQATQARQGDASDINIATEAYAYTTLANDATSALANLEALSGLLKGFPPSVSKITGPLGDLQAFLQPLQDALRGIVDFLHGNQDLRDFNAAYHLAIKKRDNAFNNCNIALLHCKDKKEPKAPEPPHFDFKKLRISTILGLTSHDPNAITGPAGFGPQAFVAGGQVLPYRIDFTNEPTATAPAQTVVVTEQLDPSLDLSTFQFGTIGFGNLSVTVPAGVTSFRTRVDATASVGVFVDVSASLNLKTGLVTWTFTSIDPKTLDQPTGNPLEGFLPPDANPPLGEGFVTYTVHPKAADATGIVVKAQARVVFDTNAPIDTAQVSNAIDAGAPTSRVAPLPATTPTPTFTVSWSGQDDAGGSGIGGFDVFVSDDGGPFTPFEQGTTATAAPFTGQVGHTYAFFSTATDNVGNVQAGGRFTVQAETTVSLLPPGHSHNQDFVAHLYLDLLHRAADATGLAGWSQALDQGWLNSVQVVQGIEASVEYRTDEAETAYQALLGRAADPQGLFDAIRFLVAGGTLPLLEANLMGSAEYYLRRGGGSDAGFLVAAFHDALAVAPTGAQLQAGADLLAGGVSRTEIAARLLARVEAQAERVAGYYERFLRRVPDLAGWDADTVALQAGLSDEAVLSLILGSAEYSSLL